MSIKTNIDLIHEAQEKNGGELTGLMVSIPGSHLKLWVEAWENGNLHVYMFEPLGTWKMEVFKSIPVNELARVLLELGQQQVVAGKTRKDVAHFVKNLRFLPPENIQIS